MKFTFIQDIDFMVGGGGAESTDRAHFIEGIRRGHDLGIVTPNVDLSPLFADNNHIIISNMMARFQLGLFQELVKRDKPCIWFFHDYQPLCKFRLFYPMLEKCKTCYRKERWMPIFLKAKLLIWLSPLHRESWLWSCPELEQLPYAIVPSPVGSEQFHDLGGNRKGVVSVNSLVAFKGMGNVIKWTTEHPKVQIDFIGGSEISADQLPPNCKYLGPQPFWTLNELYNKYESILHLPGTPQPFERAIAEAYLAGCGIIGNKLIGALSYDWFKSRGEVAEHCSNSPRLFWEKIEGACG